MEYAAVTLWSSQKRHRQKKKILQGIPTKAIIPIIPIIPTRVIFINLLFPKPCVSIRCCKRWLMMEVEGRGDTERELTSCLSLTTAVFEGKQPAAEWQQQKQTTITNLISSVRGSKTGARVLDGRQRRRCSPSLSSLGCFFSRLYKLN